MSCLPTWRASEAFSGYFTDPAGLWEVQQMPHFHMRAPRHWTRHIITKKKNHMPFHHKQPQPKPQAEQTIPVSLHKITWKVTIPQTHIIVWSNIWIPIYLAFLISFWFPTMLVVPKVCFPNKRLTLVQKRKADVAWKMQDSKNCNFL